MKGSYYERVATMRQELKKIMKKLRDNKQKTTRKALYAHAIDVYKVGKKPVDDLIDQMEWMKEVINE